MWLFRLKSQEEVMNILLNMAKKGLFLALLAVFSNSAMEMPESKSTAMPTTSELKETVIPTTELKPGSTYFELLPAELRTLFLLYAPGDTDFEQMDNAIVNMRAIFMLDEKLKDKFLSDVAFNRELVDFLSDSYNVSNFEAALMLNTPASLRSVESLSPGMYVIKLVLEDLLHYSRVKSEPYYKRSEYKAIQAIQYAKRFFDHPYIIENFKKFDDELMRTRYSAEFNDVLEAYDELLRSIAVNDFYYGSSKPSVTKIIDVALRIGGLFSRQWLSQLWKPSSSLFQRYKQTYGDEYKSDEQFAGFLAAGFGSLLYYVKGNKNDVHLLINSTINMDSPYKIKFIEIIKQALLGFIGLDYIFVEDWDLAKKLIKDLHFEDSILILAIIKIPYVTADFIDTLITFGANPNSVGSDGVTVLMQAVQKGRADIVKLLLNKPDINIHTYDNAGHNALFYAQQLSVNKFEIIQLLENAGAHEREACIIQ